MEAKDEWQMETQKIGRNGSLAWMGLAPSVECKRKRKSEWMDKWNWKEMDT